MLLHPDGRLCHCPLPLLTHLLKQLLVLLPQLVQSMLLMPRLVLALCQLLLQGFTLQPGLTQLFHLYSGAYKVCSWLSRGVWTSLTLSVLKV